MPMKIGIVGLPNAGKSTLFNALTKGGAETGDYPFTTVEPNVAVAAGSRRAARAGRRDARLLRAGPRDDRLPRHRRPGQRRLARARGSATSSSPRSARPTRSATWSAATAGSACRTPTAGSTRSPTPRRSRPSCSLADLEQPSAAWSGSPSRRGRATPRRSPSATGWSGSSRRSPPDGPPARSRSRTPRPTRCASSQPLTAKPILYVANVDEGDDRGAAGARRARASRCRRKVVVISRPDRGRAARARPRRGRGDARRARHRALRPRAPRSAPPTSCST